MKKIKIIRLLLFIAVLFGCASSPSSFVFKEPSEGKAVIYLVNCDILKIDGKHASMGFRKQYEINSKPSVLTVETSGGSIRFEPTVSLEAGKKYSLIVYGDKREGFIYNELPHLEVIPYIEPTYQLTLTNNNSNTRRDIRFSPDGSYIAIPKRNTIEIYNMNNFVLEKTLTGHSKNVSLVSWSQDGTKIISREHGGKVWNVSTGNEITNSQEANALIEISLRNVVSPNARYFANQQDNITRVFPVNGGEPLITVGTDDYDWIRYKPLFFKDNNTLMTALSSRAAGGRVGLAEININTGNITKINLPCFNQAVYHAERNLIIGMISAQLRNEFIGYICVVDATTKKVISTFTTYPYGSCTDFDVSVATNKIAVRNGDDIVYFWDF